MRHGDNQGNEGRLRPGDVQWMTAGRGIIHSEMPEQEDGLMWGFQLWVNLAAKDKMSAPRYQEIKSVEIPTVSRDGGVSVRLIAGELDGATGAVNGIGVDPTFFDIALPPGTAFEHPLPPGHAAFCYIFEGSAVIGAGTESPLARGTLAVLGEGNVARVAALGEPARVLLIAGRPHGEPIVKHGPFVMNTTDEIAQAIDDFQSGCF